MAQLTLAWRDIPRRAEVRGGVVFAATAATGKQVWCKSPIQTNQNRNINRSQTFLIGGFSDNIGPNQNTVIQDVDPKQVILKNEKAIGDIFALSKEAKQIMSQFNNVSLI